MVISDAEWSFHSEDARHATSARESLRRHLRSVGATEERCVAAEMILGELLANVVAHAPGPVWMWLECVDTDCVLNVLDTGAVPWTYSVPLSVSALAEHGRGLLIAQKCSKNMSFKRSENPPGTHITAVLRL